MDKELLLKESKEISLVHPARIIDFSELEKGLFEERNNKNINVSFHPEYPNLALFKYSNLCVEERNWNKFTLMARGLVLDLENKKVVNTPFIKFFNGNEIFNISDIITEKFYTQAKYDGSLISVYFFDNKWRSSTIGSFISEQAQWAEKWLYSNVNLDNLIIGNTYLFEVIYPENKIVVSYDFSGLVLLTVIDEKGREYSLEQIDEVAQKINTKRAKTYSFKEISEIVEISKTLSKNEEGFVVRFENGIRIKIKGEEYIIIHKLLTKITPLGVWRMLLNNYNINEKRKEIPEEFKKDFDVIVSILQNKLNVFIDEVKTMYQNTKDMTDKELGLYLQEHPEAFKGGVFEEANNYIFSMRNNKFYKSLNKTSSFLRQSVFNIFRPDFNILEGYKRSSIIDRFSEN